MELRETSSVPLPKTVWLYPLLPQQQDFDNLRQAHIGEQRQRQDWPIQGRKVREGQRRGHGRIWQQHPKGHD